MLIIAALALAFAGFGLLAFSLARHYRDHFRGAPLPSRQHGLRLAGWVLVGSSLTCTIKAQGLLIGVIFWIGAATPVILSVALLLTYIQEWRRA